MSVQVEIRAWLLSQQDWLQETADRILKKDSLTEEDFVELCELLKSPSGREITKHRSFDSLDEAPNSNNELRLKSMGNIVGIENLAPSKPLVFQNNLVVVYGHNGSGKSGYTRILKRATGKPRAAALRHNVFKDEPHERRCDITYSLGEQVIPVEWHADSVPVDDMRSIDIFDSDEASHYLMKESEATYTPRLVRLFDLLVNACDQIKARLEQQKQLLVKALPASPLAYVQTDSIRVYNGLNHATTDEQIALLTKWTVVEDRLYEETITRLSASNPAADAKQKRATKRQVEFVVNNLNRAASSYGLTNIETIREARRGADTKRKIAKEAAFVSSAELNEVGSGTWRALWEAARAYSQVVYPGNTFPVVDDALCVLCHQELAPLAQQRLRDFETFVQSKLEAEATAAEVTYQELLNALITIPSEDQILTQCEASGLNSDEWKNYLIGFWSDASKAREGLLMHELVEVVSPVSDVGQCVKQLTDFCQQLEAIAVNLEQDAISFDRPLQEQNKLNLEALKWTSGQAESIRLEVDRQKKWNAYSELLTLVSPLKISLMASKVAEKVITEAYVKRFNDELQMLGAKRLRVELIKTRTVRGKAFHQLCLAGLAGSKAVTLDHVLSEGERRIIGLAAFMADVTGKVHASPFVFDDPISSLDQRWEESTIDRLIKLSQTRQVIIFTHRLSLLGLVVDKVEDVETLNIRHESWGAGESGGVPLFVKRPEGALNKIKTEDLPKAKAAFDDGGYDAYYPYAKSVCTDVRTVVERLVEHVLLADIILRHRRQIKTLNKLHELTKITSDDCDLIEGMMSRYSTYLHPQTDEAPVELPDTDVINNDIEQLLAWLKAFKTRKIAA